MLTLKNDSTRLAVVLTSLLVGFYVDVKCINWTLVYGFFSGRDGGFMSLLYPSVVAGIFAIYCTTTIKNETRFSPIPIFLGVFLILFYLFTSTFIGPPRVSVAFFSLFTIVGLILPSFTIVDGRCLLMSVMLWPCFAIFRLDQVFQMTLSWKAVISMDASYAFMIPVIATIVYLFSYFRTDDKRKKVFITIITLINLIFFLQLFQYGSRGPLFAIFLTIVFLLSTEYSKPKKCAVINKRRFFIALGVLLLIILSVDYVFVKLLSITEMISLNSTALEKIVRLSAGGDLSNGRNILQILALEGFWDNVLFGNGLDRFDANTGLGYPHNFVIQILYDGGLLLFCVLLIPIVMKTFLNFKKCSYDQYIVQTFLLFSSVPYAFFSQDLWENAVFWLFVGSLFSSTFVVLNNNYEVQCNSTDI